MGATEFDERPRRDPSELRAVSYPLGSYDVGGVYEFIGIEFSAGNLHEAGVAQWEIYLACYPLSHIAQSDNLAEAFLICPFTAK
jgi:hypothetical protein